MGELCFRDYELVQAGCLLIKPVLMLFIGKIVRDYTMYHLETEEIVKYVI